MYAASGILILCRWPAYQVGINKGIILRWTAYQISRVLHSLFHWVWSGTTPTVSR